MLLRTLITCTTLILPFLAQAQIFNDIPNNFTNQDYFFVSGDDALSTNPDNGVIQDITQQQNLNNNPQGPLDDFTSQIQATEGAIKNLQGDQINLRISPTIPGPFENVQVSLIAYGANIPNAAIGWYVDGKLVDSGFGKTSITVQTKASGQPTSVGAIIRLPQVGEISKFINLTPQDITVLWESFGSTTPPFYKGKALPTTESTVKTVTVGNFYDGQGKIAQPKDLVYTWRKNGRARDLAIHSGRGKNSAYLITDFVRKNHNVSVAISTPTKTSSTQSSTFISTSKPLIRFYENNPDQGTIFEKALLNPAITNSSQYTVHTEPYFFSGTKQGLSYDWRINGSSANNGPFDNPLSLTIEPSDETTSNNLIRLDVKKDGNFFQSTSASLPLTIQ